MSKTRDLDARQLPEIPDDDTDFTPELARKIIAKYQDLVVALSSPRAPDTSPSVDGETYSARLAEKLSGIVLQMERTGDWRMSEAEAQTVTDAAKWLLALSAPRVEPVAVQLQARRTVNEQWIDIFPAQVEWMSNAHYMLRAIETRAAAPPSQPDTVREGGQRADELDSARAFLREKPSTSYVQRKLGIGYNRASRIMEQLEEEGFISRPNSEGMRTVLPALPPDAGDRK